MKKTDKLDIQKEKKFDAINKYIIFLEYSKMRAVRRAIKNIFHFINVMHMPI